MILYPHTLLVIIAAVIAYLVIALELPVILAKVPKELMTLICFIPSGFIGAVAIKFLSEKSFGEFSFMLLLFLIALYGGFAMKDFDF